MPVVLLQSRLALVSSYQSKWIQKRRTSHCSPCLLITQRWWKIFKPETFKSQAFLYLEWTAALCWLHFFYFTFFLTHLHAKLDSDWLTGLCCKRHVKTMAFKGFDRALLRFLFLCSNHHDLEHHHSGILVTFWLGLRHSALLHTDLSAFPLLDN